jgi:RNA polymerase sigma factor (sigma-70 family)
LENRSRLQGNGMATTTVSHFFRRLARDMEAKTLADHSDQKLVERALSGCDAAAFQAIVHRHGPMVYRVCWRVSQHAQDAEDAFQATFLVLVQRLRQVRKQTSLASWLHGVAHRVALRAKARSAIRRAHEQRAARPEAVPPAEATWGELRGALDSELSQLPNRWRLPLILCYLEGRTQEEAASHLGWSKSTVRRRLEEGRTALGLRLNRRGIMVPAALSAILLSDSVVWATPAARLVASTVEAAAGTLAGRTAATVASAHVAALTEGVLKTMFLSGLKVVAAVFVILASVGAGAGRMLYDAKATEKAPEPHQERANLQQQEKAITDKEPTTTIDGLVDGKKVQPDPGLVDSGAEAAIKLLAASNVVDFNYPGQQFDKAFWQRVVTTGIQRKRTYLRFRFGKPRQIPGKLNGANVGYIVSELVFFDPTETGPVCLCARDGDKYYFANQLAGQQDLVEWLGMVTTTIDGFLGGKKVQSDQWFVGPGAEAAIKLLAASHLTDFFGPSRPFGQADWEPAHPIGQADWQREVPIGIKENRPYLRVQFGVPRQTQGSLNGKEAQVKVSEVVFFEPGRPSGPICLWARNGDKYYFANQIFGHEELAKWIAKWFGNVQGH